MEATKETKFDTKVAQRMRVMSELRIHAVKLLRKHTIPHSMMKNNRNIIECCNNTHQGAACTGKQMCTCILDLGDDSHLTCKNVCWPQVMKGIPNQGLVCFVSYVSFSCLSSGVSGVCNVLFPHLYLSYQCSYLPRKTHL